MAWFDFIWTDEIIEHLAEHGVSPDDFKQVVCFPEEQGTSKRSGRPVAWGYTADGRHLMAVYEMIDEMTVLPVTAFEVPES